MADNQHYVPVCYLKGFALNYPQNSSEKRDSLQTYIYNNEDASIKLKGLNNICYANKLYDLQDENGSENKALDDFFRDTEDHYSKIAFQLYQTFVANKEMLSAPFSDDLKTYFCRFILNQWKRVPKFYERMKFGLGRVIEDIDKKLSKDFLNRSIAEIAEGVIDDKFKSGMEYLFEKKWALFVIRDENKRFITTDNPVVLLNSDGLANDETEIVFPINEKLLLHLNTNNKFQQVEVVSNRHPKLNHDFLREVNIKIASECLRYVISSSKDLLKSITTDLQMLKKGAGLRRYRIV